MHANCIYCNSAFLGDNSSYLAIRTEAGYSKHYELIIFHVVTNFVLSPECTPSTSTSLTTVVLACLGPLIVCVNIRVRPLATGVSIKRAGSRILHHQNGIYVVCAGFSHDCKVQTFGR